MTVYLLIAIGGAFGANARFFLASAVAARYGTGFPYGTFVINATGSFIIGLFLATLAHHYPDAENAKLFVATGILGGYTTFSTFTYETIALVRDGSLRLAWLNALGSGAVGIAGAGLGIAIANLW